MRSAYACAAVSFVVFAYSRSESTDCSCALSTISRSKPYSRTHGPVESCIESPPGIVRYAFSAASSSESSPRSPAARASACAATACASPEAHGGRPEPYGNEYSQSSVPRRGIARASSESASCRVPSLSCCAASAFSCEKLASGWNSSPLPENQR